MTAVAVKARCERCGQDLVVGGAVKMMITGKWLCVVQPCPVCDTVIKTDRPEWKGRKR